MVAYNSLKLRIPVLVTLLAIYPLIAIPYVLPRWAALAAISILALLAIFKEKIAVYNDSFIPLGFFLLFAFISSCFSEYPREAWLGSPGYLSGFFTYVLLAILFIFAYGTALIFPAKLDNIIDIWLLSAGLIALFGLLQYLGLNLLPLGTDIFKSIKSSSTIYNSNDLGTYLLMAFPFAALRFIQDANFRSTAVLSLIYGTLLTTLCRSAWVGLAPGVLLLIVCCRDKKKVLALLALMLVVTLLLMPLHNWSILSQMGTFYSETGMTLAGDPEGGSARSLLWQEGVKALPKSVFIGSGADTFYHVSPEKFAERFGEGARAAHKAHNIYLEIAVTMGIPALLAYLWFLFSVLRKTDKSKPLELAFFLMVIMYMTRGFFLVDVITVYPLFLALIGLYQGVKVSRMAKICMPTNFTPTEASVKDSKTEKTE